MSWKQIVWTGLPVFILCAILLWLAISNAHLVVDIMRDSITHEKVDFSSFNDKVASAYQSDEMNGKNDFININGLFMKAAGRETCNNVELMENGMLTDVKETSNIEKTASGAAVDGKPVDENAYVSMNMWGFPGEEGKRPDYLRALEEGFRTFFEKTVPQNPLKAEYLLPIHIGGLLEEGKIQVAVLEAKDKWFGVTYREDKEAVQQSFRDLIAKGVYREDLYSDL